MQYIFQTMQQEKPRVSHAPMLVGETMHVMMALELSTTGHQSLIGHHQMTFGMGAASAETPVVWAALE